MQTFIQTLFIPALFMALLILFVISPVLNASELNFERCLVNQGAQQIDAECATLKRVENPDDPNGRVLDLAVVKFPSRSLEPAADAFTLIQGGPGGSSINLAITYSRLLEGIRKERDIIIMDQRGTGRSNRLACEMPDDGVLGLGFDPERIKRASLDCIDKLDADLRFYTTSVAVQDLEALRAAAGYHQLTLYGVSYGTRVAQHYLRQFPDKTRAVILDGVVPVGLNLAGGEIARRSQAAFEHVAQRCNESEACYTRYGDIRLKFQQLRDRLESKPMALKLPHPISGETIDKRLTEADLAGVVRLMIYATEGTALLPMIISSAHAENYVPLAAQALMINAALLEDYATGMNNSVMCAEDAPFVEAADLENLENTYFGDEMAKAIDATCQVWPRGRVDQDFHQPFSSDHPILILSGETDPITPPQNGRLANQMFRNSMHTVVPFHGHGVLSRGCIAALATDFVAKAIINNGINATDLNTDCVSRERPMPFFDRISGPKP